MKLLTMLLVVIMAFAVQAESVVGKWKQIDDETGKMKSIIEIYEQDGEIYGKIVKLFREPDEEQNPICDKCKDHRKDQPILGMEIISGLEKDGDVYKGDKGILDPKKGMIFDCEIWLDSPDVLNVKGKFLFISRTQTWYRLTEE